MITVEARSDDELVVGAMVNEAARLRRLAAGRTYAGSHFAAYRAILRIEANRLDEIRAERYPEVIVSPDA